MELEEVLLQLSASGVTYTVEEVERLLANLPPGVEDPVDIIEIFNARENLEREQRDDMERAANEGEEFTPRSRSELLDEAAGLTQGARDQRDADARAEAGLPEESVAPESGLGRVGRDIAVLELGEAIDNGDMTTEEAQATAQEDLGLDVQAFMTQLAALRASEIDGGFLSRFGVLPTPEDYEAIAAEYKELNGSEIGVAQINALASAGDDWVLGIGDRLFAGRSDEYHHVVIEGQAEHYTIRRAQFDRVRSAAGVGVAEADMAINYAHQFGISHLWGDILLLGVVPDVVLENPLPGTEAGLQFGADGLPIEDQQITMPGLDVQQGWWNDPTNLRANDTLFGQSAAQLSDLNRRIASSTGQIADLEARMEADDYDPRERLGQGLWHYRQRLEGAQEERQSILNREQVQYRQRAREYVTYLAQYGGNRYVAMIAAVWNPVVADQVWENDGALSADQAQNIREIVFGGNVGLTDADLVDMGIDIQSFDFQALTQPPGPGQTIFYDAPDSGALREAHTSLFKAWFGSDPSEGELGAFVGEINGALEANARARLEANKPRLFGREAVRAEAQDRIIGLPQIDPGVTSKQRARRDPRYAELFGRMREDQNEETYIGQFADAAADLFGARHAASNIDARLAGQRTGDTDTTIGRHLFSEDVVESETFVARAARLAKMIERMT